MPKQNVMCFAIISIGTSRILKHLTIVSRRTRKNARVARNTESNMVFTLVA